MSNYSDDQTQPADSLVDRGVDDVLDEGMSPPERPFHRGDGTLADRLAQEEPDVGDAGGDEVSAEGDAGSEDGPPDREVGDERSGRLMAPDQGAGEDTEKDLIAQDVGIDGGAASAEEAAMHVTEEGAEDVTLDDPDELTDPGADEPGVSEPPDE